MAGGAGYFLRAVDRVRSRLMPPSATVEFFFSPGSRYCYLAASQLPALERDSGCRVDWRPVSGTAIRRRHPEGDPFEGPAPSGQYDWAYRRLDAERWAACYGVPYFEPPGHEFDFDLLVRAAMAGRRLGRAAEVGWGLCCAVYGRETWPVDEDACSTVAEQAGLDGAAFRAELHAPGVAEALDATAAEAFERGAFGVPTFALGDALYWGNDRLVLLRHALAAGRG